MQVTFDAVEVVCAHCGKPIRGGWVIEIDDRSFHAAGNYRGADRRRCRDAAEALRVDP